MTQALVDKSALVRLDKTPDVEIWLGRIQRGLVHITCVTLLEVGYSARSANDLSEARRRPPLALMPVEYMTPLIEDRALAVQEKPAEHGHHRAASIPDLLIAATAELAGLDVLHSDLHTDKDFELIAEITGQPTTRLV